MPLGELCIVQKEKDNLEEVLTGGPVASGTVNAGFQTPFWHPSSRTLPVTDMFSETHPRPWNNGLHHLSKARFMSLQGIVLYPQSMLTSV